MPGSDPGALDPRVPLGVGAAAEEIARIYFQSIGQSIEAEHAGVANASFNCTNERAVEAGLEGEFLLRDTAREASRSYRLAECP